jgi:protein-tyrosine-phosphatase
MDTPKLLFLSTKNSARSQIAEALLKAKAPGKYDVYSAGTSPEPLDPLAVAALRELGIDISDHPVNDVANLFRQDYKFVITICSRNEEKCPVYPLATWLHWDISYPRNAEDFRQVRDEISRRIDLFLNGSLIHDGDRSKLGSEKAKEVETLADSR